MDVTFVLSAIIFTLLAIVVATSLLNGSSPAAEFANARSYFGYGGDGAAAGPEPSGPRLNGHVPDKKKKSTKKEEKEEATDDWCEISGSSHDHWDVVKSVLSTEGATESPGINDKAETNNSLKYVPGKARSHHLEMMMSKEELEEEQRRYFDTDFSCL